MRAEQDNRAHMAPRQVIENGVAARDGQAVHAGGQGGRFAGDAEQLAAFVHFADMADRGGFFRVRARVGRRFGRRRGLVEARAGQPGVGRNARRSLRFLGVARDIHRQIVDEEIAQIAEAVFHGGDAGLFGIERQPMFGQRGDGGPVGAFGLFARFAQHDEIVGETDEPIALDFHVAVEIV